MPYMDVHQVENEGTGTNMLNIQSKGVNSMIEQTHYVAIGARARVVWGDNIAPRTKSYLSLSSNSTFLSRHALSLRWKQYESNLNQN